MRIKPETELEHRIIGLLFDALLEEGYFLKTELAGGAQWVYVHDAEEPNGASDGFVKLVRGNGASVISDYSVKLEATIMPALELSDIYGN